MQTAVLFIAHALNGLLMIGMPIALAIYLTQKFHLGWRLWFIGATGFIISQVFHIPFLRLLTNLFNNNLLPAPPAEYRLITNAIILGLAAGLFEEVARYIVLRIWATDARTWRKSIMLGAGHGGAEAIILGGLVFYTFIQMVAYKDADLSKLVPADQLAAAQQQISAYWSATWYSSLLGAVERFFTIPVQICLSVLVMQVFTRRHIYWLGLAILWHAVMDGFVVYLSGTLGSNSWRLYGIEGVIAGFSLISVLFIFILRQPEPPEAEVVPVPPLAPLAYQPAEIKETPENLDNSRFN